MKKNVIIVKVSVNFNSIKLESILYMNKLNGNLEFIMKLSVILIDTLRKNMREHLYPLFHDFLKFNLEKFRKLTFECI